ncbi:hypothetical protein OROHE_013642 [Orobanche hederae]
MVIFFEYAPALFFGFATSKFPNCSDEVTNQSQIEGQIKVDKTSYETELINEAAVTTTLTLPVTFGVGKPSDTDKYAVVFGLGSPKQQLSLLFNTFTNLMWTRCTNKTLNAVRLDLYFNSKASSSYLTIPCESCNIYNLPPKQQGCLDGTCVYNGTYDDYQSSVPSIGLLSFDRLNLTDHENSDFIFVCVPYDPPTYSYSSIRSDAGLLGLGRGDLSFISQVGPMYNNYFHYCLPSSSRYQGYLTFGKKKDNNDLKFTPSFIRTDYPSYYFINIISISVGSIELTMDYSNVFLNRGIAVDPGVSITRLPAKAYAALRDEFRNQIGKSHMMSGPRGILDTCYDNAGVIKPPTISFTFEDDVKVDFNGPQIFEDYRYTTVKCLAFADNTNPPSVSILGNTQQKTMEVAYDDLHAAGRLGFRLNACK